MKGLSMRKLIFWSVLLRLVKIVVTMLFKPASLWVFRLSLTEAKRFFHQAVEPTLTPKRVFRTQAAKARPIDAATSLGNLFETQATKNSRRLADPFCSNSITISLSWQYYWESRRDKEAVWDLFLKHSLKYHWLYHARFDKMQPFPTWGRSALFRRGILQ